MRFQISPSFQGNRTRYRVFPRKSRHTMTKFRVCFQRSSRLKKRFSCVLQCVTLCYSVLHCVAVCYIVLQCVTLCYSVLHCVAVCYIALQCVTLCCGVLHCVAVCYIVLQCVASSQRYGIGEETMTDCISMCFQTSPTFLQNMTNIRLFCWNLVIQRLNLGLVSRNRLQGIGKEKKTRFFAFFCFFFKKKKCFLFFFDFFKKKKKKQKRTTIQFQISPTLQENMTSIRLFCRNLVTKWPNLGLVSRYGVMEPMRWLRLVGFLILQVSFAKEPYKRDDILQKSPMILRSLLIVATPYGVGEKTMTNWIRYISKRAKYFWKMWLDLGLFRKTLVTTWVNSGLICTRQHRGM